MKRQTKSPQNHYQFKLICAVSLLALTCVTQAEEVAPQSAPQTAHGNLEKKPAFDGVQTIQKMLKSMGPDAVLDMMFSSIEPICQKTILSKSTPAAKAPTSAEDMRDKQYIQPAIVVGNHAPQWAVAAPNGQLQGSPLNWMDPKNYMGWLRMGQDTDKATQNPAPGSALPPKRY